LENHIRINNIFLSDNFGGATNTTALINLAAPEKKDVIIADSTVASILYNAGGLSLILFAVLILSFLKLESIYLHFWSIYLLFMITTIIFETFPANLIFTVNLAYFYWLNKTKNNSSSDGPV